MAKVVRTSGLRLEYPVNGTVMEEPEVLKENMQTLEEKDITEDKIDSAIETEVSAPTQEGIETQEQKESKPLDSGNKKVGVDKILFDLILNKKSSKIIFGICSFALILFVVSYVVSLNNARSIKTHYEKRRDNMQAMIDINIGKYQDKYLVDIHPFLKESGNIFLGKTENVSLSELGEYIDDYRNNQVDYLENQFKTDKNFSINQYVEAESSKINSQIIDIEKSIGVLDEKNKLFEDNFNNLKKSLLGLKDINLNKEVDKDLINNIGVYTKLEFAEGLKLIDFLISFDDNSQSYKEFLESNSGFEASTYTHKSLAILESKNGGVQEQFYKLLLSMYTNAQNLILNDEKFVTEKSEYLFKKSILIKELESLKKAKVSIEKYKENKTYLFQKQFDINDDTIDYTIDKAISYMALYHALLIVILFFTTVMVICSLAVGVKGWVGTDPNIKLLAMATVVILVMSNLILVTLRPRENYVNYIANAEKNEAKQANMIKFLNNYDKVSLPDLDKFINENLESLTKFSDILPSTDESKLAKDVSDFTGTMSN